MKRLKIKSPSDVRLVFISIALDVFGIGLLLMSYLYNFSWVISLKAFLPALVLQLIFVVSRLKDRQELHKKKANQAST